MEESRKNRKKENNSLNPNSSLPKYLLSSILGLIASLGYGFFQQFFYFPFFFAGKIFGGAIELLQYILVIVKLIDL